MDFLPVQYSFGLADKISKDYFETPIGLPLACIVALCMSIRKGNTSLFAIAESGTRHADKILKVSSF